MADLKEAKYEVEARETLAMTPDLRMVVLTLGPGQEVPWHWHSNVSDTFFVMEGVVVVETRAPNTRTELTPGQTHVVPAKRAHHVTGKDGARCKFANLQGVGVYDFNPVGG